MINTLALARALERCNAAGPKPWHRPEGGPSMVDWPAYAAQVVELYAEELGQGQRVPGQVEFGEEVVVLHGTEQHGETALAEPLVAYGAPDDYRGRGTSRTGQVVDATEPDPLWLRRQRDNAPSTEEHRRAKGDV